MRKPALDLFVLSFVALVFMAANVGVADDDGMTDASPVQWDAEAEKELLEKSHALHVAFDSQDYDAVAEQVADDDFLFVFELSPDSNPVKLESKEELIDWLRHSFDEFTDANQRTEARNPVMTAKATSTFGVVTEECSLKVIMPDGSIQLQSLRATSVARKGADGWKWIHWHMSASAPRKMLTEDGEPLASNAVN